MFRNLLQNNTCMACGKEKFSKFIELKDYFLTKEDFELIRCANCGLLYTHPVPEPDQIAKYYDSKEYTSHITKGFSVKNILYRNARALTLRRKVKLIEKHKEVGSILDIGAGTGNFLNHCRSQGWNVEGVEVNKGAREYARKQFGLEFFSDTSQFETQPPQFDVITMWHVLEHLEDPERQMILNTKILKEEGIMVIAIPDYTSWDACHYAKFWAAYDVPRHLYHFSKKSFEMFSDKIGLTIVELKPMIMDAFYISLLSEKYSNNKLRYPNAFINGIRSNIAGLRGRYSFSSWAYLLKKKRS